MQKFLQSRVFVAIHFVCCAGLMYYILSGYGTSAAIWNDYLADAYVLIGSVSISVLDFCGSLIVCKRYREEAVAIANRTWLESLLACTLLQFGGTTLTGVVLGQTPSWIMSHNAFPALLLAWWLTFFFPFDLYWLSIQRLPSLYFAIRIGSAISSGHAVTSWGVDKAMYNTFHLNHVRISESLFTLVLCGALSGSGGGILGDLFGLYRNPSFVWTSVTPAILQPDRFEAVAALTRSFFLAIVYLLAMQKPLVFGSEMPSHSLSRTQGHLLICSTQVVHLLYISLLPAAMDPFRCISSLLLDALLIKRELGNDNDNENRKQD